MIYLEEVYYNALIEPIQLSTNQLFQYKNKQAEELLPCTTKRGWTELWVFIKKLSQTTELHKDRLQIEWTDAAFQLWRQYLRTLIIHY